MGFTLLGAMALAIPLFLLAIPIVAILLKPVAEAAKRRERESARKTYERLALEKLDVIKTAVAMGYEQNALADLDKRLERLIGADALQCLLDPQVPGVPEAPGEMLRAELTEELAHVRRERERSQS
jgi:hypothetical protein